MVNFEGVNTAPCPVVVCQHRNPTFERKGFDEVLRPTPRWVAGTVEQAVARPTQCCAVAAVDQETPRKRAAVVALHNGRRLLCCATMGCLAAVA